MVSTNQRPPFGLILGKRRPLIGRNHKSLFPGGLILDSIDSGQCVSTESETVNITAVHGNLTCAFFRSGVSSSLSSSSKNLIFLLLFLGSDNWIVLLNSSKISWRSFSELSSFYNGTISHVLGAFLPDLVLSAL